jgi:hypothetical protein
MNGKNPTMTRRTIETLYTALRQLDGVVMESCYAADASFEDPVFTLRGRERVGGMWRMLTEATRAKGREVWRLDFNAVEAQGQAGSAHWEAHYRFSATGRMVHNRIDARFEFNADGKIVRHVDRFSFWAWSRQALGAPGLLLGWTPLLRHKVQAQAMGRLDQYLAGPRG